MISNNLSQDVKNKLGITGKSELENLKFAKELTVEQNDRIAQTYNIEYSHNNKNPEYFNIYMTDKYGNLVYTNSMSSEVVLKDRLGDELANYVIKNATEKEKTISRKEIEKYIQKIDNSNIHKKAQNYYKHTNNVKIGAYLDLDGFIVRSTKRIMG